MWFITKIWHFLIVSCASVNFYASAQRSVAGGIMCCPVRPCVDPCVRLVNIVNTICYRVFDIFIHQTYSNDALWTEMNTSQFGIKRS